jgi:hypothetical protein
MSLFLIVPRVFTWSPLLFFSHCSNQVVVRIDSRLHCTYIAIHSG